MPILLDIRAFLRRYNGIHQVPAGANLAENHGLKPWVNKQLQPFVKALESLPPEVITWGALAFSLGAAGLLYGASERPWMAVAAVPLLMARVILNAVEVPSGALSRAGQAAAVISELSDRLSDVSIFLVFAFWPEMKTHLVLLGMVAMLIVSYVGVLGKAAGVERVSNGLLAKPDRMVILMLACLVYGLVPNVKVAGFSIFEAMFVLFLPLASLTLLQRLDRIFQLLSNGPKDN